MSVTSFLAVRQVEGDPGKWQVAERTYDSKELANRVTDVAVSGSLSRKGAFSEARELSKKSSGLNPFIGELDGTVGVTEIGSGASRTWHVIGIRKNGAVGSIGNGYKKDVKSPLHAVFPVGLVPMMETMLLADDLAKGAEKLFVPPKDVLQAAQDGKTPWRQTLDTARMVKGMSTGDLQIAGGLLSGIMTGMDQLSEEERRDINLGLAGVAGDCYKEMKKEGRI